jgi:hypothetical protein
MSEELINFAKQFNEEIRAESHALESFREEVFVTRMGYILDEYGETDTVINSSYQNKTHGIKVDGYLYDDEMNSFILIISLFFDETGIPSQNVTNTMVSKEMNRVTNFFKKSLTGLHKNLDIGAESYDLAKLIYDSKADISGVKFLLVTDGIAPKNPSEKEEIEGIAVTRAVWDIERTFNFIKTGKRETISIDFTDYCNGPLECSVLDDSDKFYTTYLGFVPGDALADMYGKWGIKMLDMNVRVFLGVGGKINKGIRETIINEPEMFCAYNNGINVFSKDIELNEKGNGILKTDDFQIINGGQTVSSLFHTRRKHKADLSKISVQMKLTVFKDEERIQKMVPLISQYSNTQNKVQLADLSANEKPHPEIKAISYNQLAPDPTGGSKETYWIYEPARGGYTEFKNLAATTPSQSKIFNILRPKTQKFDKLKLGKVWNSYLRLPHVVCLGGQKNFAHFNVWLRDQEEDYSAFFRKSVALLILWNKTEKLFTKIKLQAYRHAVVSYALSWFFDKTDSKIDLEKIWDKQSATETIYDDLERMLIIVNDHIRDTDENPSMYARKEECWKELRKKELNLNDQIDEEYYSGQTKVYSTPTISVGNEIEFCVEKGDEKWFALSKWLKERNLLLGKHRSQCFNMGRTISQNREPSEMLSKACVKIWEESNLRGWNNGDPKNEDDD